MTREARPAGDRAIVTVTVAVDPAVAFEVFTEQIDQWWRRGPRYRVGGRSPGVLAFEPRVGGRLYERFDDAQASPTGARVVEVGRVTAWEPPARLAFEWRGVNFKPGESTEVEVRFEACASGTRVTVEHHGWSTLPPGHPARHGLEGAEFSRTVGLWWGDLLTSLREHIAARA